MITISYIYYNQHQMLSIHKAAWDQHPSGFAQYSLIDDCSPVPIPNFFKRNDLRIYRIDKDIPWNIAGARNLAFHTAPTDWVLLCDIDHVVSTDAIRKISALNLKDPNVVYLFRRMTPDGYVGVRAIINILMNRERFFQIGGYDEDFSGHYGREETFFAHCLKFHGITEISCEHITLDWYPRLGATRGLIRDKTLNAAIFDRKILQLKQREYKNGPILRFSWSAV